MKQLILCLVLLASSVQAQCPPGQVCSPGTVCPTGPGGFFSMDWRASPPSEEEWRRLRQLPGALAHDQPAVSDDHLASQLFRHANEYRPAISPAGVAAKSPQPAVVRVICTTQDGPWMGTGVLVRPPRECEFGVILTVDHGIPARPDSVSVVFHDCRVAAKILGRDASLDLAVLSIRMPRTQPYEIATEVPRIDDALWAGGYAGAEGRFQVVQGKLLHYATPDDPPGPEGSVLMLAGSVETGVSGGAIADYRGRLVGIVSGSDNEVVVGTHCVYLRKFLNRVLPPATPGGMSPMVPPPATGPSPPTVADHLDKIRGQTAASIADAREADSGRLDAIEAPIAAIGQTDPTEPLAAASGVAGAPPPSRSPFAAPTLLESAVPAALTALGWTGPPSVVALLAARFGLAAWRRRKRRIRDGGAADSADAFPEGIASVPRDDTEAKQLLQLSRLEGRSPVHDAIIGRFAFDELANTIDRQPDGPEAKWARSLRRTLEDRFNETAPVAVYSSP